MKIAAAALVAVMTGAQSYAQTGQQVSIAGYATVLGHCARPAWLGSILMADYFDAKTQEERSEVDLEAGAEHVVLARWDRRPERTFSFKILKSDGTPAAAEVMAEGDGGCDSVVGR